MDDLTEEMKIGKEIYYFLDSKGYNVELYRTGLLHEFIKIEVNDLGLQIQIKGSELI